MYSGSKYFLLLVASLLVPAGLRAQTPDHHEVGSGNHLRRAVQQSGFNSNLLAQRRQHRALSTAPPWLRPGRQRCRNADRQRSRQPSWPQPGHSDLRSALHVLQATGLRTHTQPCDLRAGIAGAGMGLQRLLPNCFRRHYVRQLLSSSGGWWYRSRSVAPFRCPGLPD